MDKNSISRGKIKSFKEVFDKLDSIGEKDIYKMAKRTQAKSKGISKVD